MSRETVLRASTETASAVATYGAPIENHKVAFFDVTNTSTYLTNSSGRFVAKEERELVIYRSFAIVQVRVVNAACFDIYDNFARARVWYVYSLHRHGLTFSASNYTSNFIRHVSPFPLNATYLTRPRSPALPLKENGNNDKTR